MRRVALAPDSFRGSLAAVDFCEVAAAVLAEADFESVAVPMADGGEGTLSVLGGPNRWSEVVGPLGHRLSAPWRLVDGDGVIESAQVIGLELVGGAEANDAVAASSLGLGVLIAAALEEGVERLLVTLGGSATTDGGRGCVEELERRGLLTASGRIGPSVEVEVALDTRVRYADAARVYGPQKGASPSALAVLNDRLLDDARWLLALTGVDVTGLDGSGAAGGLGGALMAIGARGRSGASLVAGRVGLASAVATCDLVISGEGRFDATSLTGKVVGHLVELTGEIGVDLLVLPGQADDGIDLPPHVTVHPLSTDIGVSAAIEDPEIALRRALERLLESRADDTAPRWSDPST